MLSAAHYGCSVLPADGYACSMVLAIGSGWGYWLLLAVAGIYQQQLAMAVF